MNTTKFKQDFIGPLFIDTALDKTHYRLKNVTGLLLVGTYHVNRIKKGSACTPLGIVDMQGATAHNSVELGVSFGYYFFCLYLAFGECCESVP